MYYSLAQIIVIARGDDGWMNILVLVVLAAVYGLGALIKAKGKQSEDQDQEQQTGKPQRKPSAGGRGILEQLFKEIQQAAEGKPTQETRPSGQATRQQTARPQAAVRKYAAETKQIRQTQPLSPPVKSKLSKPTPHVQRDFLKNYQNLIQALNRFLNIPLMLLDWLVNLSAYLPKLPTQCIFPKFCPIMKILTNLKGRFCITKS
ncbi:MAG: hypothetical protein ACYS6K_24965 [Planctomycetota bacterium]|jgi:hypothetical protein